MSLQVYRDIYGKCGSQLHNTEKTLFPFQRTVSPSLKPRLLITFREAKLLIRDYCDGISTINNRPMEKLVDGFLLKNT